MSDRARVAILGAGSWGSAFALAQARRGNQVRLWARDARLVARLNQSRQLGEVEVTGSMGRACGGADVVVLAVPSSGMRPVCSAVAGQRPQPVPQPVPLVSLAKGLESGTGLRPTEIVQQLLPAYPVCALSGPTPAGAVARGEPTRAVVAAESAAVAERTVDLLTGPTLVLTASTDLVGVELAGALKNVVALIAGAAAGLGLDEATRSRVVAAGAVEVCQVVERAGRLATVLSPAGLQDLLETALGGRSRNHRLGASLARGEAAGSVDGCEAATTAPELARLLDRLSMPAPVLRSAAALVGGRATADDLARRMGGTG